MTLGDLISPVTSSSLSIKLERLHALLQPSEAIPALAVVIQARALGEGSVLFTLAHLTLVLLGGGDQGDWRGHVALLHLPVLHAVARLLVECPGLSAVAGEAPAHEALAVGVTTALTEENCMIQHSCDVTF